VTPAYRTSHEEVRTRGVTQERDARDDRAEAELPAFYAEMLRALGPNVVGHLRFGRADREIVLLAEEIGADLIVMGTHGRTKLERFFRDSVAERVLRAAPCAVCVLRAKKEKSQDSPSEAD